METPFGIIEQKRRIKKETFLTTLYDKDLDFYFLIKYLLQNNRRYASFIHLLNTLHSFKKMTEKFYENYSSNTIMYNFLYHGLIGEFRNLSVDLWELNDHDVNFRTKIDEIGKRRSANVYFYLSENAYFHLTLRITHKKLTYINRFIFTDFVKIRNLYRKIDVALKTPRSLFFFKNLLEHVKNFPEDLKEFEERYLQKKILKDLALNLDNGKIYFKELEEKEEVEFPF